jgi:hypothetical protein
MLNKFLILFFIGLCSWTHAQKFASSPFSSYGIGETGGLDHAVFSGMGNTSIGFSDSTVLNFSNPSSYTFLAKGQPLFSTGISSRFSNYTSGDNTFSGKYIGLDHFALGLPIGKNFGIVFGLKPFSRTGYDVFQKELVGTDTMRYTYRGSGGSHEVFAGLAVKLVDFKHHQLSVGSNFSYIFGNNLKERLTNFTTGTAGGVEQTGYRIQSFHYDLGLTYVTQISMNQRLSVGLIYTPEQKLSATYFNGLYYSSNVNDPTVYDTLALVEDLKGHLRMPATFGFGFTYTYQPKTGKDYNRIRIPQFVFSGDLKMTNWSDYSTDYTGNQNETTFSNTMRFSVGVQYMPHYNYLDRSTAIGFLSRVRYRAGFQHATLPVQQAGKQLTDQGFTVGLGLPIISQRSSSSINIGLTAGKRGNGVASSLNENYLTVNFGITLSPGQYDRWFRKYKID